MQLYVGYKLGAIYLEYECVKFTIYADEENMSSYQVKGGVMVDLVNSVDKLDKVDDNKRSSARCQRLQVISNQQLQNNQINQYLPSKTRTSL